MARRDGAEAGVDPVRSSAPFLWVVRAALRAIARVRVEGLESVPESSACLVVFNQLSLFDTPLLRVAIPRSDVAGLVSRSYRGNRFFRFMVERGGGIWLERGSGDRLALHAALAALERGWVVGISPEGRRSRSGALERGKPGVVTLATRAEVPIVPMAITGMERLAPDLRRLSRTDVTVRFGPAFRIEPPPARDRKRWRQEAVDDVMYRLAALLPERYRGVYAAPPPATTQRASA
jgi:1-acyl-sn-glycerol-3-phosphate acyltransferase